MKKIKEVAKLVGISVRTLQYYDEIGLFSPSFKTESGYRLYNDNDLKTLQQILFFREFDIPLKEIKSVMASPNLDRNQILQMQRKMLIAKKERMERLISAIDDILKGENCMDFTVFNDTEIRIMYDNMVAKMNEEQKAIFIKHYGTMEAFEAYFLESASSKQAQKNFAQLIEWYGSKEAVLESANNAGVSNEMTKYQVRMGEIQASLASKVGTDVSSLEVQKLVEEYISISKKLYQMEDVTNLMLDIAKQYKTDIKIQESIDLVYGVGSTEYMGMALEAFYNK